MTTRRPTILYAETNAQVLSEQVAAFEKAGYTVVSALGGRHAVEVALAQATFDVVVLGHTISKDDRHHLPYRSKKLKPYVPVLVLHASCKHPRVDLALDSRRGERVVLEAVAELIATNPVPVRQMAAVA